MAATHFEALKILIGENHLFKGYVFFSLQNTEGRLDPAVVQLLFFL